jgi:hypothetical protein
MTRANSRADSVSVMHEWLEKARAALEESSGQALPALNQNEIDELLDLARVAAHESGDRTNAPLVCYLLGRSQTSTNTNSLPELVDTVIRANDGD